MSFLLREGESDTWAIAKLECEPNYQISLVEEGTGKMVKQSSSGLIYQLQLRGDSHSIKSLTLGVKNFKSDAQRDAEKMQAAAQTVINKELLP